MKDMIKDTLQEYYRKGDFIRIYPSKNSDIYDQYFVTSRPSNKFIFRCLYSNEFIPFPINYPIQLKPIMESPTNTKSQNSPSILPQTIEQFKSDHFDFRNSVPVSNQYYQFNLNPKGIPQ